MKFFFRLCKLETDGQQIKKMVLKLTQPIMLILTV